MTNTRRLFAVAPNRSRPQPPALLANQPRRLVDHIRRNVQRRPQAHRPPAASDCQQPDLKAAAPKAVARLGIEQIERHHQPASARRPDHRLFGGDRLELGQHPPPHSIGVADEVLGLIQMQKLLAPNHVDDVPAPTKEATEMLCLREHAFEFVSEKNGYKIYKNDKKYVGIIMDQEEIENFKKEVSKYSKPVSVYVFSLTDEDFSDEFSDMKKKVKVCSIPEAILRVYRRIFK